MKSLTIDIHKVVDYNLNITLPDKMKEEFSIIFNDKPVKPLLNENIDFISCLYDNRKYPQQAKYNAQYKNQNNSKWKKQEEDGNNDERADETEETKSFDEENFTVDDEAIKAHPHT